jgi:GTP-binding protein
MDPFIKSFSTLDGLFEYQPQMCVIGRSNSGKSSLLNALLEQKTAKTSSKPGSTQLLNLFKYKDRFLVDLPGYGYAKISKSKKLEISRLLGDYLSAGTFQAGVLLLDCNRFPEEFELYIANLFKKAKKPLLLLLTKMDRLNQKELYQLRKKSKELNNEFHSVILVSSHKKIGIKQVDSFFRSF